MSGDADAQYPSAPLIQAGSPKKQKRLLVIGPSNIGDGILISDCIAALHHRYPKAHTVLVVGARAQTVFAEDPRIQTLVNTEDYGSVFGRLRLAFSLWKYQPHIVVDLRSTAFPFLLKPWSAWRYALIPPKSIEHMRDRHLWKLRRQVPGDMTVPVRTGESPPSIWLSPRDYTQVEQLWRRWALDKKRPLVVICPGARSHIKRWLAEGFAEVADRLIIEQGVQVVFLGEPQEEPIIQDVLGRMKQRATSAVGLTTVRQAGVFMKRARLVITNDSASLHLASSLDVPTLAIFGPTDAKKYGPTASRHRTLHRQLFCSPCETALCQYNHECMRFIPSEEVYKAASELLSSSQVTQAQRDTAKDAS